MTIPTASLSMDAIQDLARDDDFILDLSILLDNWAKLHICNEDRESLLFCLFIYLVDEYYSDEYYSDDDSSSVGSNSTSSTLPITPR